MEDWNFYFGWVLYDILCLSLFSIQDRKFKDSQRYLFAALICFLFFVLALYGNIISPDYWPYRNIVNEISHTEDPFTHIEPLYIWLIHQIGNHFYIYQLFIYLPQFILLYLISVKLPLFQVNKFLYLFAIVGLYPAIVGRFFLYNTFIICSIIAFGYKKNILGLALSIASLFLHKLGLVLTPILLLFIILPVSFKKSMALFLLTMFVIAAILARYYIQYYLLEQFELMENINGANYLKREEGQNAGGSLWWQVIYIFQIGTTIILGIRTLIRFHKKYPDFKLINKLLYKCLLGLILMTIFYFSLGLPDQTIGSRILGVATIPLCYFMAIESNYFAIKYKSKITIMLWALLYFSFTNIYIIGVSHINL